MRTDKPQAGDIYIPRFGTIVSPNEFHELITSLDITDKYYIVTEITLEEREVGKRYEREDNF